MIAGAAVEARLRGLDAIGSGSDGFHRLAWTAADAAAGEWFAAQAAGLGLRVERDAAGNRWACPAAPPPWWGVGSHLDTVAGGGRYDGALGVACAFEIARAVPAPVAVVSFADEEGARFNTPTFGSRALTGRLDVEDALARVDADGVTLAAALAAAGVPPERLARAPEALQRLRGFLEVHIDQSRALADAGAPVGVVSALAARMRVAAVITGRADHAGTTRRHERSDALAAAARLIVAAEERAPDVVTPTRLLAEPNAATTISSRVRLWLDARAPVVTDLDAWRSALDGDAARIGGQRRVSIALRTDARSPEVTFDAGVREALAAGGAPELVCYAGHDAGILATRLPAGMVLVRNQSGVSHHGDEHVDVADAALAARAVAAALGRLA